MTAECLNDELGRLMGALCDGSLNADDLARLDALVATDEAARRAYNNYMFLHAELYSQHATLVSVEQTQLPDNAPKMSHLNRQRYGWLAAAAALVGVAAVSSWLTYTMTRNLRAAATPLASSQDSEESRSALHGAPAATVARITATRNCLWQAATNAVGFGSRLHAGQRLDLAAGLVEITFDDGAAVVLEGPATFDVRARGQAHLHEGRLSAIVPQRAAGFEVATSRVNVIDVGTEFGLMAAPEGTTEIHVFNGLVKAQLLDERGNQVRTMELNTSEGARIQPATALVARIPARHEEFVRTLSVAVGPHDGLYAYDGFNYPAGPLAEQNGGFGWAGPWFTVEADAQADATSNGVAAGSLEHEGLVPLGNRAVQKAHQNRIRRSLGTSVGGVFDAAGLVENQDGMRLVGRDGAVVYLSFLQRVDKPADVFYGVELHRSDGNANRVLCIGHGAEGTGYGVTSNFNVYGQRNFPKLGQETSEANFFVVRMTFGPGNRDRVEVLRNPESLIDENACIVDAELVGNFAFDRISLGNFHGTKVHEVDEIRVGTTFRAVTGRRSRGPDRLMPRVAGTGGQDSGFVSEGLLFDRDLAMVSWLRTAN
ncbi:MAG: FecR domain-containing protein [Pirellulales bacterium]